MEKRTGFRFALRQAQGGTQRDTMFCPFSMKHADAPQGGAAFVARFSCPAVFERDSGVRSERKPFTGRRKIPTISGEDSQKQPCRRFFPASSPAAISTHFCRWRYPQLHVDVAPFVGNGLSLRRKPSIFLPLSDQSTRTTIHSVAAKPVGRNGDLDIPVGYFRCGKFLHLISFGRLGTHPGADEYSCGGPIRKRRSEQDPSTPPRQNEGGSQDFGEKRLSLN